MARQYNLSDTKLISDKMFWFMVKILIPKADYDTDHLIQFGEEWFAVGDILEHEMVPSEKDPTKQRREYLHLRSLSQKAAGAVIDYLKTCPEKGTQNGPVQTIGTVQSGGMGSVKPRQK